MADITPSPVSAAHVPTGSRVVLVVSRGPLPGPRRAVAPVPDLRGKEQGHALEQIQSTGLNAQVFNDYSDRVNRGHVIDQFPLPGSSVATAAEVVVLVSNGAAEKTTQTALPDVVGLHEAEASSRLATAGLGVEVARDYHPNVEAGVVIAQLPSQSSIANAKRGRSYTWLIVALAAVALVALVGTIFFLLLGKQVAVPSVTTKTQAEAEQILARAGLTTGDVGSVVNTVVTPGIVIRQDPQPGVEVKSGSAVDLTVAVGKPEATVPNLLGLNAPDANTAVTQAGFVPQVVNVYSENVPSGAVVTQDPAAGTKAPVGSTVRISVSQGPASANVTVPDFDGMPQAEAIAKAASLGLKTRVVAEYSGTVGTGIVFDQAPDPGKTVPAGTTIGLGVSAGPAPAASVTVPELVGQTESAAQQSLSALGLGTITVQWDSTGQPSGIVVQQTPAAGHIVPRGGNVTVFVSSGK